MGRCNAAIILIRVDDGIAERQKRFAISISGFGDEMVQEVESRITSRLQTFMWGKYVRRSLNMRLRNCTYESIGMGEPHNTNLGGGS